jgi:hypothetical protein
VYIAVDPGYYLPLQTGLLWILTPVKGSVVVNGWAAPGPAPWFDLYLGNLKYLELRVVAIDLLILAILMIGIPIWCRRERRVPRLRGVLSATIGLLFGLTVFGVSFIAQGKTEVLIATAILTLVLYVASLSVIGLGRKSRS